MGMETPEWKQGHQDEPVETLELAWGHMNGDFGDGDTVIGMQTLG